jgi:hypothetical protein
VRGQAHFYLARALTCALDLGKSTVNGVRMHLTFMHEEVAVHHHGGAERVMGKAHSSGACECREGVSPIAHNAPIGKRWDGAAVNTTGVQKRHNLGAAAEMRGSGRRCTVES